MGIGMSKVVEGLYLGSISDAEDKETLTKHGITHILSVHNNAKPLLEGMTYLCISASDSSNQNLIQHFKECISFIHECRLHGEGCLIHCLAGVSRSTTILVAYLMTVTHFGWKECLAAAKAVRSYVSPNFGFQKQLQEYETTLLQEGVSKGWLRAKKTTSYKLQSLLGMGCLSPCIPEKISQRWFVRCSYQNMELGRKLYRTWVQMEYGKNPLPDQEELQRLLSPKEEKVNEPQIGLRETKWNGAPSPDNHEPHTRYGDSSNSGHHQGTNR